MSRMETVIILILIGTAVGAVGYLLWEQEETDLAEWLPTTGQWLAITGEWLATTVGLSKREPAAPTLSPQPRPSRPSEGGGASPPQAAPVPVPSVPSAPAGAAEPEASAAHPAALGTQATRPSGSSVQAGQPVEHCVKPPTPVDAFAVESGKALGMWVDVEIDPRFHPGRCLYVIERADKTRWVVDSSRARVRK
ncbi:MAG: hypothetical protein HYS14_09410 [Candidatus Rokubacteria bacterium]|nr:hypothetical protein [Candidatus Rokubacteria bacterium]